VLKRSYDVNRINYILNHPDVFDYVSYDGQDFLDLTDCVKDDSNIILMSKNGFFFFRKLEDEEHSFEAHQQFLKSGRGKEAHDSAIKAVVYIFSNTPCTSIYSTIPKEYRHAKLIALMAGFRIIGETTEPLKKNGVNREADILRITFEEWDSRRK